MTPEEKLLALIQQDKRQADTVTPQEKLLELIEQDKRKPEPALPVVPVVLAVPPPVIPPAPVPVKPPAKEPPVLVKTVPVEVTPPVEIKKAPLVVAAAAPVKPSPVTVTPKAEAPVIPMPAASPAIPPPLATQQPGNARPVQAAPPVAQPLMFPSIRVSGVTVTNRVLAGVVLALIVLVFYSVSGTQHSINDEIKRQLSGAGEMSVPPRAVSGESVPAMDVFVDKASTRNFFAAKVTEKGKDGAVTPVTVGLSKDFKLVAVSMDATTASDSMAIIKNKADSKTYFVKIGESVGDTGFVLSKVLADRIVLKQRKQEFELK